MDNDDLDLDSLLSGESEPATQSDEDVKLIARAKKNYQNDKSHWDDLYDKSRDDLDFLSDEPGAQWEDSVYSARVKSGRPTIEVDQLTQFVHQVANNIRMNTPAINPIASGSKDSVAKAEIMKGLIKKIEYVSCADVVYDTGALFAIKCGIGFAIVDHDYEDSDDSFDQSFIIKRVINPFMIYMDSATTECDGRDQWHCHVLEKMKVSKFREENPEAVVISYGDNEENKEYQDGDDIIVAQYYERIEEKEEIKGVNAAGTSISRTRSKVTINRYRLSGKEVLSRTTFPGEYVPVVPFYGEEAWNDGKRNLHSLIRKSKGAQQSFNYMQSSEAEVLIKQPMAPVMTPAGAIENYADDWKDPSKAMALRYDVYDSEGRLLPKPERLLAPQVSSGYLNASNESLNNIKATMGLYSNNLGQQGQEVSGKAIDARKIQGDVATYHFGDNTVRSITHIGRIIVCASHEIYDTPRMIGIMDEENKPKTVGINGMKADGQTEDYWFNKPDKYDVRVITGQSFTTRRQESASFYQNLIEKSADMFWICGDLMLENMDVEGSQALAARVRKVIDQKFPGLRSGEDGAQDQQDPEKLQLQQQIKQAGQVIQQLQGQMQLLQKAVEDKSGDLQVKQDKNHIDLMKTIGSLSNDSEKNDITEQKNAGDLAIQAETIEGDRIDQLMAIMQQIQAALNPQSQVLPGGNPVNPMANDGSGNNGVMTNG